MEIYTYNVSPGIQITVDTNKILGITMTTNGKYEDLIKLNYDEKKAKIKINIIQSWSKRSLTLFGKVTIIKKFNCATVNLSLICITKSRTTLPKTY
jgi:hypothetical protein